MSVGSSHNASARTCLVGVSRDGLVGVEVQVALEGKPDFAAHGGEFRQAHVAKFEAS